MKRLWKRLKAIWKDGQITLDEVPEAMSITGELLDLILTVIKLIPGIDAVVPVALQVFSKGLHVASKQLTDLWPQFQEHWTAVQVILSDNKIEAHEWEEAPGPSVCREPEIPTFGVPSLEPLCYSLLQPSRAVASRP